MKKIIYFLLFGLAPIVSAQTLSGPEIVKKVNELMNQKTMSAKMTMTITTTSGQKRTFEYQSYSSNFGEKNLMIYLKPGRVKGQKMLMTDHADNIWYYNARTKRVRKLASHAKKQKFEGSDFSYEDMGSGNSFVNDYDARLRGDEMKNGFDCYKVELVRKESATTSYPKLMMWVVKSNFVPIVIDYYDDKKPDRVLKSLIQSDIREIDGVPTAMKMEMKNLADNTSTTMQLLEVQYNVPLDEGMFTERGLKR